MCHKRKCTTEMTRHLLSNEDNDTGGHEGQLL